MSALMDTLRFVAGYVMVASSAWLRDNSRSVIDVGTVCANHCLMTVVPCLKVMSAVAEVAAAGLIARVNATHSSDAKIVNCPGSSDAALNSRRAVASDADEVEAS